MYVLLCICFLTQDSCMFTESIACFQLLYSTSLDILQCIYLPQLLLSLSIVVQFCFALCYYYKPCSYELSGYTSPLTSSASVAKYLGLNCQFAPVLSFQEYLYKQTAQARWRQGLALELIYLCSQKIKVETYPSLKIFQGNKDRDAFLLSQNCLHFRLIR